MSDDQQTQKLDDPFGETDATSMEDILASIRTMIADEDTPSIPVAAVAATPISTITSPSTSLATPQPTPVSKPEIDLSQPFEEPGFNDPVTDLASSIEADLVSPTAEDDLSALLAPIESLPVVRSKPDLDFADNLPETSTVPTGSVGQDPSTMDMSEFDISADSSFDIESLLGEDAFDIPEELSAPTPAPVPAPTPLPEPAPEPITEAKADLASTTMEPIDFSETEDMDLVKSLMADLTEESDMADLGSDDGVEDSAFDALFADDAETPDELIDFTDDLTDDLDIPDIEMTEVEVAPTESSVPDVLDDILEDSIADEEAIDFSAEPIDFGNEPMDEIDIPEIAPAAEAPLAPAATVAAAVASTAAIVSLSDIAARADAEAAELVPQSEPTLTVETLNTEIVAELHTAESEIVLEPEVHIEPEPAAEIVEEMNQALEEEVMARTAAPLEEIVADEVETEAASAFAELNKLIDEKSIVEERGPRIGDIVAEALKPMLKDWLDDNLKGIVERAVAKEVKRISSGK